MEDEELSDLLKQSIAAGDTAAIRQYAQQLAKRKVERDRVAATQQRLQSGRTLQGAVDVLSGRIGREAQPDLGEEGNLLVGKKPLAPEVKGSVADAQRAHAPGAADVVELKKGNREAEFGTDIERALKEPGARETIVDGRRAVTSDTRLLAIRNEDAPLGDAIESWVSGGETGTLSLLGNVFDAPVRALATVAAHRAAEDAGDTERLARSKGYAQDAWDAFLNRKGNTISEGGLVATRESAWGDFLRYTVPNYLKKHPEARLGDYLASIEGVGSLGDLGEKLGSDILTRRLDTLEDKDYEFMGMALSIPLDPLNFLPIGKLVKGSKAVMKATPLGKAAEAFVDEANLMRRAPEAVTAGGLKKLAMQGYNAATTPVEGVLSKASDLFLGTSPSRTAKGVMRHHGVDADTAKDIGNQAAHALSGAAGEQGNIANEALREMQGVIGSMKRKEGALALDAAENANIGRAAGDIVDEFRMVGDDVAEQLPPRLRKHLDYYRGLDDAAVADIRAGVGAIDKSPWNLRFELAQAVNKAAGKTVVETMSSVDDIAKYLERVHGLKPSRARVVAEGSRNLAGIFARSAGRNKEAGALSQAAREYGYVPHIAKGLGTYNPLAPRKMAMGNDLHEVRFVVEEALQNPNVDPVIAKNLASWFDLPAKQQAATRNAAVSDLNAAGYGFDLHAPIDDLVEADRLVKSRYLGGASMENDPRKVVGRYLETITPMTARAEAGVKFAEMESGGFKVAKSLTEVLAEHLDPNDFARYTRDAGGGRRILTNLARDQHGNLVREVKQALVKSGYAAVPQRVYEKMPALKGMVVSEPILKEIDRLVGKQSAQSIDAAFKLIGKFNKFWVPLLLATPGFHVRNWMYGQSQLYMAIGAKAFHPGLARDAHMVATLAERGAMSASKGGLFGLKGDKLVEYADEMRRFGLAETGQIADLERLMSNSAAFKDEWARRAWNRVSPWSRAGPTEGIKRVANRGLARVVGGGGKVSKAGGILEGGASVENLQRAQLYVHLRRKGVEASDAAEQVVKFFFDYTGTRLSQVEKGIRQVLPFYQWLKYSNVQIVDAMLTNQKFRNMQKTFDLLSSETVSGVGQSEDPRVKPGSASKRGAIRVPGADGVVDVNAGIDWTLRKLGREPGTGDRYWAFERPGPNLIRPSDFAADIVAQMGLLPKAVYERTTGKYSFGGAEISPGFDVRSQTSQLSTGKKVFEFLAGMPTDEIPAYLIPLVGGPNANVLMMYFGQPKNPRFPDVKADELFASALVSMMTGQKVIPADPMQAYSQRIREADEMAKEYDKRSANEAKKAARGLSPFQRDLSKLANKDDPL